MKIIRYVSKNKQKQTGILQANGNIKLVHGDIFSEYTVTNEESSLEDIERYLIPADIISIIALGGNYAEHVKESNSEVPKAPLIFIKAISSLTSHNSNIVLPKLAPNEVDYEAELGVIISKKAKNIQIEQALNYVLGYTCVNDVSARDCQLRIDKQWARGKSFDAFCPVGPVIETELNPSDIRVKLFLNNKCMQEATTKELIFSVPEIISYLSQNMTLMPGTLILTGTPGGVGCTRNPPIFLKSGDKVVVDIEGIGLLENNVITEQREV